MRPFQFDFSLARFIRSDRGNIAIIFALTLLPVMGSVGAALDYAQASSLRSKLQSAIDAASVGAVARVSPAYVAAGAMTGDGIIAVGETDARNIFKGNTATLTDITDSIVTAEVRKTGQRVDSTVSFQTQIKTSFLSVLGFNYLTIAGSSSSSASMPSYIDFYLLLDNSPSMGFAATDADGTRLKAKTGGCAFACHDKSNTNSSYKIAKDNNILMRIDVLRDATRTLMDTATNMQTYTGQFRMALYDFNDKISNTSLRRLFTLSSSLSSAKTAANALDLMSTAKHGENSDQGTQFTTILPLLKDEITGAPGTGTKASPLKYMFFVSDGLSDEKNSNCIKPTAPGQRCQAPIDTKLCTAIKDKGIKIAVLYTTYLDHSYNDWYRDWIAKYNIGPYQPSLNSEIAKNMETCASPGLFFEVSPTQGITEAMIALFQRALADARIVN